MKKLIPLSLMCMLLLGVGTTQAQTAEQPVGFKVFFGTHSYNGDLGNEIGEFGDSDFLYGLGLSAYLSPAFDISLDAQSMNLDRVNGPNDTKFAQRNTSFSSDVVNLNLMLHWKPFPASDLNPYLAAGVGGNFVQYGSEVSTEESNFVFSVPFGVGVNYELKDNIMLNVQGVYNRTWDDKIDNYPLDASDAIQGVAARDDLDGVDHDDFFTLSIGAVYTFGGDDSDDMSMEQRMLQQSMKNLKAAEGSSDEASATLQQAQQLNDETLAALEELRNAIDQMPEESEDLKAEIVNIVNNIQFEFDSEEIIEPAHDELNSLASIMQEYDALKVDIAAHADERGSTSYNEELSMRRAQAVKNYMVQQGVSQSRITTSAMGEDNPLMSGNNETAYGQNRSVQVTLSYDGTKSK